MPALAVVIKQPVAVAKVDVFGDTKHVAKMQYFTLEGNAGSFNNRSNGLSP
jgi:hypothetical protein